MALVSIKHGTTEFATLSDNKSAILNCDGKYITDGLSAELTISNYDGSIVIFRVGGRIFYDDGDNGATYTFYNASMNVLPTQTVAGLADAYYYTVTGTPTKDRWYVYDTAGLTSDLYWGYYGTSTGATSSAFGSGKTNTQKILNMGVPTDYTPNIWSFIKGKRDANYNGCNDWFIASKQEQDELRTSGLVDWYSSNNYIWYSTESNANTAYLRDCGLDTWYNVGKRYSYSGFAARAF